MYMLICNYWSGTQTVKNSEKMCSINIAYSWKLSQEKTHILLIGTTVRCHTPKFCGENLSANSHTISKLLYGRSVPPPPQYYISRFWRPIKSKIWKLSFFWQLKSNGNGRLLTCKLQGKFLMKN